MYVDIKKNNQSLQQISETLTLRLEPLTSVVREIHEAIERRYGRALRQVTGSIISQLEPLASTLLELARVIEPYVHALLIEEKNRKIFARTSWLPSPSYPVSIFNNCSDNITDLDKLIEAHYRKHWPSFRKDFKAKVENCKHLDEESKGCFLEALEAHQNSYYRLVPRSLIPEFERIFRLNLLDGNPGKLSDSKIKATLENDSEFSYIVDSYSDFSIIEKFSNYLYENVNKRNINSYKEIPNRHAALHGVVPYSTFKNSMNMLILAEYFLRNLSANRETN